MKVSAVSFFFSINSALVFGHRPCTFQAYETHIASCFGRTVNIRHSSDDRECCASDVVRNLALFREGVLVLSAAVPTPGAALSVSLARSPCRNICITAIR